MQMKIEVWNTSETVTVMGPREGGAERVIWQPSSGGPGRKFDVVPNEDEPLCDTISRKLRTLLRE